MRKIKYIISLLVAALLFFATSCKKDSENLSKITYFPVMTLIGDGTIILPEGATYTDSGVTSTINGSPVPVTTSVSGDYFPYTGSQVDVTSPNKYILSYTSKNTDGFSHSIYRNVYVVKTGDLVNSIEGLYTSTVVRNTVSAPQYTNMQYVMIIKTGANTYELSDDIGGYYDIGRGYGAAYRATGIVVTANNIATNSFSFAPVVPVGAFGGNLTMVSFTVDPVAKTINFETDWDAGFNFVITLTQVNI